MDEHDINFKSIRELSLSEIISKIPSKQTKKRTVLPVKEKGSSEEREEPPLKHNFSFGEKNLQIAEGKYKNDDYMANNQEKEPNIRNKETNHLFLKKIKVEKERGEVKLPSFDSKFAGLGAFYTQNLGRPIGNPVVGSIQTLPTLPPLLNPNSNMSLSPFNQISPSFQTNTNTQQIPILPKPIDQTLTVPPSNSISGVLNGFQKAGSGIGSLGPFPSYPNFTQISQLQPHQYNPCNVPYTDPNLNMKDGPIGDLLYS